MTDASPGGVLVVGGTGVDTIVRVGELPVPLADSHVVPPIDMHVGHTGTGVALGLQRLGVPTRIVDVVGDDHEGWLVRDRLAAEGIPFDTVIHPSGTRRAVNLVDPTGRRLSLYDPRHPYDLVPDASLWLDALAALDAGPGARHVHASIMPWTVHALDEATRRGLSTSTDLHDWDGHNPHHRPFAEAADVVFVSGSALGGREDDVVADVLARGRARLVIVMDGARGSRVTVRDGERFAVPALDLPGRAVVDSNGAGDAYVSGFLRSWLAGGTVRDAARAGAVAGAWACGAAGTHADLVDAAEMDRQLVRLDA
ncbi:carbohydrate kinase family protein [Intrasporangium sp. YIM S08009]|uniref:carbohydrate kinase family protein n=1 Tax=Intrasporangium zincisolvens TaxID=3080018 RepID=UPI002B05D518|nr:carbohydrate kinase family protein [Intrasporangium sp. YIM S08009]